MFATHHLHLAFTSLAPALATALGKCFIRDHIKLNGEQASP
jgi:hypothetical protein